MSLGQIRYHQPFKPAFGAQPGVQTLPSNIKATDLRKFIVPSPTFLPAEEITQGKPQQAVMAQPIAANNREVYVPSFKPNFFDKTLAYFTTVRNVGNEMVKGGFTGLVAGGVGAGVGFLAKGAKAHQYGAALLAGSTVGGGILGSLGKKEKVKGAAVGASYGAVAALVPTLISTGIKLAKKNPSWKAFVAATTIGGAVAGGFVGKYIANGKVANIFMRGGAVHNMVGKQDVKRQNLPKEMKG